MQCAMRRWVGVSRWPSKSACSRAAVEAPEPVVATKPPASPAPADAHRDILAAGPSEHRSPRRSPHGPYSSRPPDLVPSSLIPLPAGRADARPPPHPPSTAGPPSGDRALPTPARRRHRPGAPGPVPARAGAAPVRPRPVRSPAPAGSASATRSVWRAAERGEAGLFLDTAGEHGVAERGGVETARISPRAAPAAYSRIITPELGGRGVGEEGAQPGEVGFAERGEPGRGEPGGLQRGEPEVVQGEGGVRGVEAAVVVGGLVGGADQRVLGGGVELDGQHPLQRRPRRPAPGRGSAAGSGSRTGPGCARAAGWAGPGRRAARRIRRGGLDGAGVRAGGVHGFGVRLVASRRPRSARARRRERGGQQPPQLVRGRARTGRG